jgi:hypothetical protein
MSTRHLTLNLDPRFWRFDGIAASLIPADPAKIAGLHRALPLLRGAVGVTFGARRELAAKNDMQGTAISREC